MWCLTKSENSGKNNLGLNGLITLISIKYKFTRKMLPPPLRIQQSLTYGYRYDVLKSEPVIPTSNMRILGD